MALLPLSGGFQRIGKGIYMSSPANGTPTRSSTSSRSPTLILTFGWMGAKLSHLMKYTTVHRELYPDAVNIVIQCEPSFFISREATCQANLEPVIEVLEDLGYLPSSKMRSKVTDQYEVDPPRVLIHTFSNGTPFLHPLTHCSTGIGGCSQLTCFSRLLKVRYPDWDILAPGICALVLDSCPGLGTRQHIKNSISTLVRNPILRGFLRVLITWLFYWAAMKKRLFRSKDQLEVLKMDLNRPNILPWTRRNTPRLYLCSKVDTMVALYEVEGHAKDAKATGFEDIRFEVFDNTAHVKHAKLEPERYWGAVKAVWDAACQQGQANI
ncbi:hypothetical protein C0993_009906 [Termitomyces sp. T159_Od127]|nr:hypothetical protein C0993_009906 [Termitomyces sp. T159_Od127]